MNSQIFLLLTIALASINCRNLEMSELFNPINVESDSRVANGAIARPGEFPWHVTVYVRRANNWIFCAGALVSNQAVLTEADCLKHGLEARVIVGATLFGKGQQVLCTGFALHPKHNAENRSYNLAVLRLKQKVATSHLVQHILLPPISYEHYPFTNQVVRLSGHGSRSQTQPYQVLRWGNFRVQSVADCSNYFNHTLVANQVLCTIGPRNVSPGFGDRGAPLVWRLNNQNYLVGIFAFSGSPEQLFKSGIAGFLNVAVNVRWVNQVIKSIG